MSNGGQQVPVEHKTSEKFRVIAGQIAMATADPSGSTVTYGTKNLDLSGKLVIEQQIAIFYSEFNLREQIAVLTDQLNKVEELRENSANSPKSVQMKPPERKKVQGDVNYQ